MAACGPALLWLIMRGLPVLSFLLAVAFSQKMFSGDQVLRIRTKDQKQLQLIRNLADTQDLKVDFWHAPARSSLPVDMRVPFSNLNAVKNYLNSSGISYTIMIKDIQGLLDKEIKEMKFNRGKEKRDANFNYGAFHSLDELYGEMSNIASEYPNLVSLLKMANSFEKRPLYVLKFSTGKGDGPAIWLNHGLHSQEWITHATGIWIARKIASDFSENKPTITSILNKMDIFLMPVANPDGYAYSYTTDRFWRKNRSPIPGSICEGVDLSRNWDVAFSMGSHDPCSSFYHGSNPHSEVEVKSIANFIKNHGNFKSFIDFHSSAQLLMYPYGYTKNKCPDCDELGKLARDAARAPNSLFGTNYQVGSVFETLYFISGSSTDWAYENGIKYVFTFELQDTGKYGFLLPPEQILPVAQETWLALEVIMVYVKDHLY
ncbi:carboxypeptidase A4-like [Antechinus flavipes]|uniref:carboxypeptidase A4-like n=1 Tax=Antechinus flavipes TaxID=38775 RepID=UPI002235AFD5|nr:carboxypeptidase A4-like [Antechinus flavipes]